MVLPYLLGDLAVRTEQCHQGPGAYWVMAVTVTALIIFAVLAILVQVTFDPNDAGAPSSRAVARQNYELFIRTTQLDITYHQYIGMSPAERQGYLSRAR